ncbi:MAG TPA: hypothetical protein VGM37_16145 [Armatimonadota bacterium]|jgi:hypothetical protein
MTDIEPIDRSDEYRFADEDAAFAAEMSAPPADSDAPPAEPAYPPDVDPEWAAELPDLRPEPVAGDYSNGIHPDDWRLAEYLARQHARMQRDRALVAASVDAEIAAAELALAELKARKAQAVRPYDASRIAASGSCGC